MRGTLFTRAFLDEGITETLPWRELDAVAFEAFRAAAADVFAAFSASASLNEADTEKDVIWPVLAALGWQHTLTQQSAAGKGRADVPDVLLFADAESKQRALSETSPDRRYRHGLSFVESKKWLRPLDRAGSAQAPGDRFDEGTPSNQMLRYLSRVEAASDRRITWGILTNGRDWRLYWQGARSRAEEFLELDLPLLLQVPGRQPDLFADEAQRPGHYLRVFFLLFRREAFLPDPQDGAGRTFHRSAHDEGRHWEARVSDDLSGVVFQQIFPDLVRSLAAHDPQAPAVVSDAYLGDVRNAALTLLYRLLFVLYAEDRSLLPTMDARYDDYSLRRLREDIVRRTDARDAFSTTARRFHHHLNDLFQAIDQGDRSIGLPAYDGGLFLAGAHPVLDRTTLPDATLAPILDGLCRLGSGTERKWINFRDLSVQHLGSIYERLLEFEARLDAGGAIAIRPDAFARRTSGSYYTHDDLVKLVIERAVGPLVAERVAAFTAEAARLATESRSKRDRMESLERLDPAARILDLRVCDPAMGSGHFLVSLVDWLADRVLEELDAAPARVTWAPKDYPYRSPLAAEIVATRTRILDAAAEQGWTVSPDQLDDRHIVRRMILKRVVFGVDRNPMAVELAKVALWLHTFTAGAPLSFLDHHLRCGDSLLGEWLGPVLNELHDRGALLIRNEVARIENVTARFDKIGLMADADITEVQESRHIMDWVSNTLAPLARFLDFRAAVRWLPRPERGAKPDTLETALAGLLDGRFGDPFEVVRRGAAGVPEPANDAERSRYDGLRQLLALTSDIAARERFLHFEIAFPGVWRELNWTTPKGGFDAVIGNPPWDRIKLQEVEWFAGRRPEIALAQRAADRKRLIDGLKRSGDPLAGEYEAAAARAEQASRIVRTAGAYPLLARGDVNLYSLFVERAQRLVAPCGTVGLLTPSGIAADQGASVFFHSVATTGRLGTLLDFENRRPYFPDVHRSFKFCTFVFAGADRTFPAADCAFYLHDVAELAQPGRAFPLRPEDFAAFNPNTGTAPVFRSERDARITAGIYRRIPPLVDRRTQPVGNPWAVRYVRMFDMTNDSKLFVTRGELESSGFYPVGGNIWRKGPDTRVVPLYEGKMVQMYDHRAASVVVNPANVFRPARPEAATDEQHADPAWVPEPQFWVAEANIDRPPGLSWTIAFKDVTAPTNVRTMIAAVVPLVALGNTLPAVFPDEDPLGYARRAPLLLAALNSLAFDYVARQKVQGQHLNWYIVEQLPVPPPDAFDRELGGTRLADFVREEVLRLSYTAHDLAPFARDLGYAGPPYAWDEEDRRHRMARLDALFFHLYGVARDDAADILETFPIIREQDERRFGDYRTKRLVLAYLNAVAAGDLHARVDLQLGHRGLGAGIP